MLWQMTRTVLVGAYGYLVLFTVWQDLTRTPEMDGTPLMSALVYFLWPVSILVIWGLVNDVRTLRSDSADYPALRWSRAILSGLAVSALILQFATWRLISHLHW